MSTFTQKDYESMMREMGWVVPGEEPQAQRATYTVVIEHTNGAISELDNVVARCVTDGGHVLQVITLRDSFLIPLCNVNVVRAGYQQGV